MSQSPRLSSTSRPVFALLCAFALFSACVPILGIDGPIQPEDTDCRPFKCSNGNCDYTNAELGTACNISMMCDGKGNCKAATRSDCTKDDQCAANACVDGTCRNNVLGPCTDWVDCKSNFCDEGACRSIYGEACMEEAECSPGHCVDNVCRLSDSSPCDESIECASASCVGNSCRYSDGSQCNFNEDCASGGCDIPNKTCLVSASKPCESNAECASNFCLNKLCTAQSCAGILENCGVNGNAYCCESPVVTTGTFNRSNDSAAPAALSAFRLDRFEVTVARFRRFVDAYPESMPAEGTGHHPHVDIGWDPAWDQYLPATHDELSKNYFTKCTDKSTWSASPGTNDRLPINCIDWYLAFAFCAWDGGYLPTEAEWNYAAAGGNQQRLYPWSNPPGSSTIDESYAVYNCLGGGNSADCSLGDILPVGSKSPKGDGPWGHVDLAGSMAEWTVDWYSMSYPYPCTDCAQLNPTMTRVLRGGAWSSASTDLTTTIRKSATPGLSGMNEFPRNALGIRCARPADAPPP